MSNINIRIYDKLKDFESIDSFLLSRKESHNLSYKDSEEWFKWKFLNSPNGSAIMPTAFDDNMIVGANYYGIYPLFKNGEEISAILPYEIFVHQSAQGKGLFKKLIKLAEQTAQDEKVQIMMSFPNKKSIQGFKSSGWTYIPNSVTYWLKPVISFKVIKNILDLKKAFQPNKSTGSNNFQFGEPKHNLYKDQIHGLWSKEYLNWRFNILPQAEYIHLQNESFEIIARIGSRGKLKETQLLYVDCKTVDFDRKAFKKMIKQLTKDSRSDLISFPMSSHYPIYGEMKSLGFYKLPSSAQFCYKVLDENIKQKELNFSLCGLDFHTY